MTVRIDVTNKDGSTFSDDKVLSFNLQKDAYTPYGLLHIKLTGSTKNYSNAAEIKFRLGGFTPHYGLIDSITTEVSGNNKIVNIVSRSFTSLVCQNQIEPGTITNVSINDLMTNYYSFPHVTWERNSATSYIYVKPNSSMWDALVNLSYKICGSYPFIRGQNEIRMTPYPTPRTFSFTNADLLSTGTRLIGRRLISHFHMSDINGDYGHFDLQDTDVTDMNIIRHNYFELDKRFLRSPQDALVFRDKYASRAWKQVFCKHSGYRGEDLSDVVSFGSINAERISCVNVSGSSSGVITEIGVYHDKFPHNS